MKEPSKTAWNSNPSKSLLAFFPSSKMLLKAPRNFARSPFLPLWSLWERKLLGQGMTSTKSSMKPKTWFRLLRSWLRATFPCSAYPNPSNPSRCAFSPKGRNLWKLFTKERKKNSWSSRRKRTKTMDSLFKMFSAPILKSLTLPSTSKAENFMAKPKT